MIPTLHSHTHCQVAQATAQTQTWQRVCLSQRTTITTDNQADEKEHRTDNSSYKKLAVQWLNLPAGRQVKLCVHRGGFCGGRQFSASKSPTSCSCKPLWVIKIYRN